MKTCLVVDDSSVIRKVARRILEGLDFKISEAEDGQQALEQCRGGMPDGLLCCNMIFILRIIIGHDSNANGALHMTQSLHPDVCEWGIRVCADVIK